MKHTILITGRTGFLSRRLGISLSADNRVVLTGRDNKFNMDAKQFTVCLASLWMLQTSKRFGSFTEVRPDIVIPVAATKYVDLSERQPMELIGVNVFGSQNLARLWVEKNVTTVIGMSTDKSSPRDTSNSV